MTQIIDIAEVARTNGLSARALRFYEARGLVKPLRTGSGRRCYGAGELERLTPLDTDPADLVLHLEHQLVAALGHAVEARRREGLDTPDHLLAHISPLGWAHILLTGEYLWPKDADA